MTGPVEEGSAGMMHWQLAEGGDAARGLLWQGVDPQVRPMATAAHRPRVKLA